jgi:dynein heavy chain
MNLQNVEKFNIKVIQLYDTIQVRHGLMIVGPTGGGKTSNYKVLQMAMTSLKGEGNYQTVHCEILNPKSITMGQLYGFVDPATLEWQNGIAAKLVADAAKDESMDQHWIMFDGPVDSLWIESMNTVLDDNKKLCLNSGQIIQLSNRMTMMFEVADLAVASPATVSRCGMVYMEPESMGLAPLVSSWLNTLPEKVQNSKFIVMELQKLYDELIDDGCYFTRKNCPELVKSVDNNLAQSSMRLLDTFFQPYIETEVKKVTPDQISQLEGQIRQMFFFAVIWSLGATTTQLGRERFDKWIREQMKKYNIDFPEEKTAYDYLWSSEKLQWVDWFNTVPEYSVDIKASYSEIVVPTTDSIRMKHVLKQLIINNKNVLMPGPTGVGKSVYISELCSFEMDEAYQMLKICFSAQTGANQTQDFLDEKFEKRRQRMYGPPLGKKYIIFVDDLNMPKKEEFGAQPPIELLRQKCDHGGWYDRKNKDKPFNRIVDIVLVSAMGPPGGGRAEVTQRLQRHYNFLTYTDISFEAITIIYKTIVSAFFESYGTDVKNAIDVMLEAQLEVYDQVLNGPLKPIPSKSHYTFNLRDISKIFQGVVATNKNTVKHNLDLVRCWIHENKRVFGDRLNDNPDRKFLDDLLVDRAQVKFALSRAEIFNAERIIFGDFMEGIDVETRTYRQITDLNVMQNKIEEYLDDYNGSVKTQMNLVMFLDACDHVARIQRILR